MIILWRVHMKRISSKQVIALSLGCLILSQATQAFTCPALTRHNIAEACRTKNLQYLGKQAGHTSQEEVTFVNVANCGTMDALRSMKVEKDESIAGTYVEKSHKMEHGFKSTKGTCTYTIPRLVHKEGKDIIFTVQTKQKTLTGGVPISPLAGPVPTIGTETVQNPDVKPGHKSIQDRFKDLKRRVKPNTPPAPPPQSQYGVYPD